VAPRGHPQNEGPQASATSTKEEKELKICNATSTRSSVKKRNDLRDGAGKRHHNRRAPPKFGDKSKGGDAILKVKSKGRQNPKGGIEPEG